MAGYTELPSESGIPWTPVLLLLLFQFCEGFAFYILAPLLPFLVQELIPGVPLEHVGYYAGYLSSYPFLGAMIGGPLFGALSDRIGRKPVLMLGLLVPKLCLLGVFVAPSFKMALGLRMLQGFFGANNSIARTYMAEVCDTHTVARGMSLLIIPFALAQVVAPIVGGLLSRPAEKYEVLDTELMRQYPYLLCITFPVVASAISLVLGFFLMPESHPGLKGVKAPSCPQSFDEALKEPLLSTSEKKSSFRDLVGVLSTRAGLMAVVLNAMLGSIHTAFVTVFPVWVVLDAASGGYTLSASTMGYIMASSGPAQLLVLPVVVPFLVRKMGFRRSWALEVGLLGLVLFITPCARELTTDPTSRLVFLAVTFCLVKVFFAIAYSNNGVFLNHAVPSTLRGVYVGMSHTIGAVFRFIVPPTASGLFAWVSQQEEPSWPLDYHLPFNLLGIMAVFAAAWSLFLPKSIESKYEEPAILKSLDEEEGQEPEAYPASPL